MTIRLDIEYLVIFDYFSSLRKVYNFIDISVFEKFQLLKIGLKLLLLNISWHFSDISKVFGN